MAPPSSVQFIETALSSNGGRFSLSYADPHQKWVIRKHLISLQQDYPSFSPSFDTFTHNDGTTVNLLYASGDLYVSNGTPIPLTIWLHENYPLMPPMVFVSPPNSTAPIHPHHPLVGPCGATSCSYLQTWTHPGSNLSKLVHNLINLFSVDHPFSSPSSSVHGFLSHPSLVSKREALDRLACTIHYDMGVIKAQTEQETERLSKLKVEMVKRVDYARRMVLGLENEMRCLKGRVSELVEEADMVTNWLKVNDHETLIAEIGDEIENAFEVVGGEDSNMVLDCLAEDRAYEDLMYALDKALEQEVVSFQVYTKQVRALARDQFYNRAMLIKLDAPLF